MAAPTFVSYTATTSLVTSGSPKTVSVAVQSGDRIVVCSATEDAVYTLGTPSDSVNTYTQAQNLGPTSYTRAAIWTATAATSTTLTISQTCSNTGKNWGFGVFVFRASSGFGASNSTNASTGGPSLAVTTTQANSALVFINGDWNATDGASRTYRQVNSANPTERSYARDAATHTVYVASYADAGATGSKTVGLSAPSTQKYTIAVVEVKGSSGTSVTGSADGVFGGSYSAAGTPKVIGSATGSFGGSYAAAGRPVVPGSATGAFGGSYAASGRPTVRGSIASAFGPSTPASGRPTVRGSATGSFGFTGPAMGGTLTRTLHKALGHAPAALSDYVTAFSPDTASGGWHRGDGGMSILGATWQLFVFNDFFISNGSGGVNAFPVNNSVLEVGTDGNVWWLSGGNGAPSTNAFPAMTAGRVVWLNGGWPTSSTSAILLAGSWSGGVLQEFQVMKLSGIGTTKPMRSGVYGCGLPLSDPNLSWSGTPYIYSGYVYVHGIHLTNFTAHVARCALSTDPSAYASAWEVWTGSAWTAGGTPGAVTIGTGPLRALSVVPQNPTYGTLLASAKEFDPSPGLGIPTDLWSEIRGWTASAPQGPWTYLGVFYQPTTLTDWFSYCGRIEPYLGLDRMVAVWSLNADAPTFTADTYGPQLANARNQLSATATGSFGFTAAASGRPVVRGSSTLAVAFGAPASGRPTVVGASATSVTFSAPATGQTQGNQSGTATGVFGFSAPAAGRPVVPGSTTLPLSFNGATSGVVRANGATSVTIAFAGPATGRRSVSGSIASAWGPSTSAAGRPIVLGAATGVLGGSAPASGRPVVRGTATGLLGFLAPASGSGTGVGQGTATGVFGFSAPAAGRPTALGVTSVALGFVAAASGRPTVLGSSSTSAGFTAPAAGQGAPPGSATLVVTFVAPASGRPTVRGSAQLSGGFSAPATGRRSVRGAAATALSLTAPASGYSFVPAAGIGGLVEGPDLVGAGAIVTASGHIPGGIT